MTRRTVDKTIPNVPALITDVLACDDCGREAPETKRLGGYSGTLFMRMADVAGYKLEYRGQLAVTLCPDCCN